VEVENWGGNPGSLHHWKSSVPLLKQPSLAAKSSVNSPFVEGEGVDVKVTSYRISDFIPRGRITVQNYYKNG
jgi:hypothetical protein